VQNGAKKVLSLLNDFGIKTTSLGKTKDEGVNVMILYSKYFRQKMENVLAIFTQNKSNLCKKAIILIYIFMKIAKLFR
jgi:hypothetical protein